MSRLKIRTLYLLLIAVSIVIFLFFITPSNLTSYTNLRKQKGRRNGSDSTNLHHLFGQETAGSDEKNETKKQTSSTQDVKTASTNSTENRKIEIDKGLLERIEFLLSNIKHRQDLSDSTQEISKEIKQHLGHRSENNVVPNETGQSSKGAKIGQRSEGVNSKITVPKATDMKLGEDEHKQFSGQKTPLKPDKEFFGKIQGLLGVVASQKMSEHGLQLFKQSKTTNHSEETPLKNPSDHQNRPDVCDSCFQNDFKYLINPESLCKHSGDLDLLIAVSTAPMNQDARNAIRNTWASTSLMESANMRCVFFIGSIEDDQMQRQLNTESDHYHDIVQLQFKDSYANLTYKTLSELRWVSEFCANTKYVMKTDSDMFVNTLILPNILKGAPTTNFIGGHCWGPSPPHREQGSKWYVSFKSYTHSSFPPMCSGTGYLMSKDLVLEILRISKNIPFFHLEDVFIALCTKKLNVKPVYLHGFSNMRTDFDACNYRFRVVTSHEIIPSQLVKYWEAMQQCNLKLEELRYKPRPLYLPV